MRYILILFFLGGLWSTTTGQAGLKLGAHLTPAVGLSFNKQDAQHGSTLEALPSFSYNLGMVVGYGITEVFSLSTGVGFHELTTTFAHRRGQLSDGRIDPNKGTIALRRAQYVRVPLLLGFNTDPNRVWGLMVRFGPHFDFLTRAVYYDNRLMGYSQYVAHEGINLRQSVTLYERNASGNSLIRRGDKAPIYKDFLPGFIFEAGMQLRVNDHVQVTLLIHAEMASNPEEEGAASLAHNLNRGDYLVTANPLVNQAAAAADAIKFQSEETPFEAVFPNYTHSDEPFETMRTPTWNALIGLQIGLVYTLRD